MHQCYGFLYIQNTCFISNYLLLCESNFSFKIRNCLLCVFYFIIHFDPRTKQKTHLKRKLNNFFQNRKIQAKKQLLKFQFTCDFTLKWRNETYETVTFQCFPLFFLFLLPLSFLYDAGGNYQGGKQQRGGGGRQPRHQPY